MESSKVAVLTALLVAACGGAQKPVLPDANSGTDSSWKTPGKLEIDSDSKSGTAADTVSYPGGDRTDWRRLKIAAESDVTFTLNVTPSRPGLDVQLKVLDESYNVLGTGVGEKSGRKKVVVKKAEPGKYYVVVYAPNVGDAGAYKLKVKVKPTPVVDAGGTPVATGGPDVPLPDKLAAIPPGNSKSGPKPPRPPREPKEPKEPKEPVVVEDTSKTLRARIVDMASGGSGTILTLDKGSSAGLTKGAKGSILNKAGKVVGSATVTSLSEGSSRADTSASMDVLGDASKVSFKNVSPPAEGGGD